MLIKVTITSGLVIKTVLNTKFSEVENKIPTTNSLVTSTASNTKISGVQNRIPDNSKYITTQEINRLTAEARLKQTNVVKKKKISIIN